MSTSTPPSPGGSSDGSTTSDDSEFALPFEGAVPLEELSDGDFSETNWATPNKPAANVEVADGAVTSKRTPVGPSSDIQITLEDFNNRFWYPINHKLLEILTMQPDQDAPEPTYTNVRFEVECLIERLEWFNRGDRGYRVLAAYAHDSDRKNYDPASPVFVANQVRRARQRYLSFEFQWIYLSAALDKVVFVASALAVVGRGSKTNHDNLLWKLSEVESLIYDLEVFQVGLHHHGIHEYDLHTSNIPLDPREGAGIETPPPEDG
ncbi:hypothetical protein B0T20DRAFT_483930 [Sordaria brevicollis]|uniref:Uncharacterized protein n=1 Tax=Sordaria brevicollis TaxID=83679 RepID=A0AAE0NWI9_SORBR|nr:hypothetical protein B0T20DRAFT_483930 [Sordaria brevicollis]